MALLFSARRCGWLPSTNSALAPTLSYGNFRPKYENMKFKTIYKDDLFQGYGNRSDRKMMAAVKLYKESVFVDVRHFLKADEEWKDDKGILLSAEQFQLVVESLPQITAEVTRQHQAAKEEWIAAQRTKGGAQHFSKGGNTSSSQYKAGGSKTATGSWKAAQRTKGGARQFSKDGKTSSVKYQAGGNRAATGSWFSGQVNPFPPKR